MAKRINTWQDAYATGTAKLDLGDGIVVPLPVNGMLPGYPGPAGAGIPAGGTSKQLIRMNTAGTTTEWVAADKALVGLSNVDNTADTAKPVSTLQAAAITDAVPVVRAAAPSGADDTAMLNAFLAANAGKSVALRPATYIISSALAVPTDTALNMTGATLDARTIPTATTLGQRVAMTSIGSKGASIAVSAAVAQGVRVITGIADTSSLAVGDLVLIRNDERPMPGLTRTDRSKGELSTVRSVDSATQITLNAGALFAYGTTGLVIEKINPVKNVRLTGGKIILGGVGSGHCGVQIQYARNITVTDLHTDGAEDTSVNLRTVWNGQVIRGKFENATSSATLGTSGYGVCIVEGSRDCLVDGAEFKNVRHGITGGGYWPASYVQIQNCKVYASLNASFDTHESCYYWEFSGNKAYGGSTGFGMRGQFITVKGNEVYDMTLYGYSAQTFDGVTEQREIRFINNRATRCASSGLTFEGSAIGAEPACLKIDGEASGNTLTDCGNATSDAMVIRHFDGMRVFKNLIQRAGRNGMYILGLAGTQSKNLMLGENHIYNAAWSAIDISLVDDINYHGGGLLVSPGRFGMNVTTCNHFTYNALTVRTPGYAGVNIAGGTEHTFNGPVIGGGVNASYDAIRVSGSSDVTVVGGKLASARWAFFSSTTEYVTICGVNMRGATSGARYSVDAVNKAITGNLV